MTSEYIQKYQLIFKSAKPVRYNRSYRRFGNNFGIINDKNQWLFEGANICDFKTKQQAVAWINKMSIETSDNLSILNRLVFKVCDHPMCQIGI